MTEKMKIFNPAELETDKPKKANRPANGSSSTEVDVLPGRLRPGDLAQSNISVTVMGNGTIVGHKISQDNPMKENSGHIPFTAEEDKSAYKVKGVRPHIAAEFEKSIEKNAAVWKALANR